MQEVKKKGRWQWKVVKRTKASAKVFQDRDERRGRLCCRYPESCGKPPRTGAASSLPIRVKMRAAAVARSRLCRVKNRTIHTYTCTVIEPFFHAGAPRTIQMHDDCRNICMQHVCVSGVAHTDMAIRNEVACTSHNLYQIHTSNLSPTPFSYFRPTYD
jgi:hypothetical protein